MGMECPHCAVVVDPNWSSHHLVLGRESFGGVRVPAEGQLVVSYALCPSCEKELLRLGRLQERVRRASLGQAVQGIDQELVDEGIIWPRNSVRKAPKEVPKEFAEDFEEAAAVLTASPRASAALSRRCLQNIIRNKLGITKKDLNQEIDEVLEKRCVPSAVGQELDLVRQLGNFAAHPIKGQNAAAIADVSAGEAEAALNVIEGLFDACFVEPAKSEERRRALNEKLSEHGKPPLKKPKTP